MKLKPTKERILGMTIEFSGRSIFKVTLLSLSIICLIGLNPILSFAQESFAIHTLGTSRSYTAAMQINDAAEDVWQRIVNVAKKRNPDNLKIKEENQMDLKFVATKTTESGDELIASLKVIPDGETNCRLIFTATMGGGKPFARDMKDMVIEILLQFCDEQGLTCKIV